MKRVLGSGSASAETITIWSAFATTTRSSGSVSSGERRSTLVRSSTRTILASDPGRAGHVARQGDPVADDDRALAELAGLHGGDKPSVRPKPGPPEPSASSSTHP